MNFRISQHALDEIQRRAIPFNLLKSVLEKTPPELAADILDHGIIMTGGGSMLKNLPSLITKKTGVPCFLSDDPLLCVVKGTGKVLDNLDLYQKSLSFSA